MVQNREGRKKRPTSQDVANLAGVSRATVSAYINGRRYVSPELSAKIEGAIRELNYMPDPFARALKMEDTKTIGLIIPVLSQFFTPMIRAINEVVHDNRYGLLLSSSEEDAERERELLEILVAKRVSGILLGPCSEENRDLLADIQRSGTPVVQVNRKIPGLEADSVVSDNRNAAYTATEYLIQKGRRKIVFLGYDPTNLSSSEKKDGYEAALKAHQVEDNITIIVKDHDRENVIAALTEFLESNHPYDGMVCSSQNKTAAALSVLKERRIRIPEDIALIGFDDTPWSSLLSVPVTVLSENTLKMGAEAAHLLLERIRTEQSKPPQHIVLESEFLPRDSA